MMRSLGLPSSFFPAEIPTLAQKENPPISKFHFVILRLDLKENFDLYK